MQKLLIYTPKITPRIQYIFDFVLTEFSGIEFELTTNQQFFEPAKQPKISFCQQALSDEIHLKLDEFLWDQHIDRNIFFEKLNPIGKIFFALSRYDEFRIQEIDNHGRISGANRVYKTPFVDQWILEFQQILQKAYPHFEFRKRQFKTVLTCDVDQTWRYKHKGFVRTWGSIFKNLLKGNTLEFKNHLLVGQGKMIDPYDQFEYFKNLQETHQFEMTFFWLLGKNGPFDKNISSKNVAQIQKIRSVSKWAEIGIHPSYASNNSAKTLANEIKILEKILGEKVTKSRQHFIKLALPKTYQQLIDNEIQQDFTMYYADQTGFRAGTCTPFYWFDLSKNESTSLQIQPFCAMDVTLKNYMKLTTDQALKELKRLKSEVKNVEGTFTILFHNSNLEDDWSNWKSVLENILK